MGSKNVPIALNGLEPRAVDLSLLKKTEFGRQDVFSLSLGIVEDRKNSIEIRHGILKGASNYMDDILNYQIQDNNQWLEAVVAMMKCISQY